MESSFPEFPQLPPEPTWPGRGAATRRRIGNSELGLASGLSPSRHGNRSVAAWGPLSFLSHLRIKRHTAPAVPPTRKLVHALLGLRLEAAGLQSAFHATLWTVPMATCKEVNVSGFEEFDQAVKEHKGKTIFAYFSGSKDAEGKSWCPDCVEGETGTAGCCTAPVVGRRPLLKPESEIVTAKMVLFP
ncbi:thioredoxin domain containing 17 [Cricetulus griseus]